LNIDTFEGSMISVGGHKKMWPCPYLFVSVCAEAVIGCLRWRLKDGEKRSKKGTC